MGEANERRKRAELKTAVGQFADSSNEHRTPSIFSLNLAQQIEQGTSDPSREAGLEATANVYTFNGTQTGASLSDSCAH
jgi:hypothetical protein